MKRGTEVKAESFASNLDQSGDFVDVTNLCRGDRCRLDGYTTHLRLVLALRKTRRIGESSTTSLRHADAWSTDAAMAVRGALGNALQTQLLTIDVLEDEILQLSLGLDDEPKLRELAAIVNRPNFVTTACAAFPEIASLGTELATPARVAWMLRREQVAELQAKGEPVVMEAEQNVGVCLRVDPELVAGGTDVAKLDVAAFRAAEHELGVCVRLDVGSRVLDLPPQTENATLGQILRSTLGISENVALSASSGAADGLHDATLKQLSRDTIEVTRAPMPVLREPARDTVAESHTAGARSRSGSVVKARLRATGAQRRGKALNETERRQIMHMLDMAEDETKRARAKGERLPPEHKLSCRRIAELTGKHPNTITNLRKQRDAQDCQRRPDDAGMLRTVEAPVAGQQGGFRWCRLNEEQKRVCTRVAVENPRLTVAQLRARLQEAFPTLSSLSDSTVWRVLRDADLQLLRAKMRDPRSESTRAHQDETQAFLKEQRRGADGMLGGHNLFFMDETNVPLNLTATRAWGTKKTPAQLKRTKGKTQTINLYAGIGLVSRSLDSEAWSRRLNDRSSFAMLEENRPKDHTPRSNDCVLVGGEWLPADEAPRFMLFWWIRPPQREETVLSRFLQEEDVMDANFTLWIPKYTRDNNAGPEAASDDAVVLLAEDEAVAESAEHAEHTRPTAQQSGVEPSSRRALRPRAPEASGGSNRGGSSQRTTQPPSLIRPTATAWSKLMRRNGAASSSSVGYPRVRYMNCVYVLDYTEVRPSDDAGDLLNDLEPVCDFVFHEFEQYRDVEFMALVLWLNNIEWRQVDEDGNLVSASSDGTRPLKVWCTLERMHAFMRSLQSLVAHVALARVTDARRVKLCSKSMERLRQRAAASADLEPIPRAYHTKTGRNALGGAIDSQRGDRNLFLQYLKEHRDYVARSFPPEVRKSMVDAFDSAPQHGKTDITRNTKSFIHDWATRHLGIRGAVFLPPSQPDFNPTELLFSFVKSVIRRRFPSHVGEVSVSEMVGLIDGAFQEVTQTMVEGWLRYGCYHVPGVTDLGDGTCPMQTASHDGRNGLVGSPAATVQRLQTWWERLLTQWEAAHYALDPALRHDLVTPDLSAPGVRERFDRARTRLCSRYRTVRDIFSAVDDEPVTRVCVGFPGQQTVVLLGGDSQLLETQLRPEDPVEITYASGALTRHEHNYASVALETLDREVLRLREDPTGYRILHAYSDRILHSSLRTRAAIGALQDAHLEESGLLATLARARNGARAVGAVVSNYIERSDEISLQQMLLDVQERVFQPKLDARHPRTKVRVTRAANIGELCSITTRTERAGPTRRTLPIACALRVLSSELETDTSPEYMVSEVSPFEVQLFHPASGGTLKLANQRVVDAALDSVAVNDKERCRLEKEHLADGARAAERELAQTEYGASLPFAEENPTKSLARCCAVAAVALAAYQHERARLDRILDDAVRKFVATSAENDAYGAAVLEDALRQWRRESVAGTLGTTSDGERLTTGGATATQAESLPPLFLVPHMRAERRAQVQLRLLARGEDDERRYPGYPLEEQDARNGKPYTVGAVHGGGTVSAPVQNVHVREVLTDARTRSEYIRATVVYEDGRREELGTPLLPEEEWGSPADDLPLRVQELLNRDAVCINTAEFSWSNYANLDKRAYRHAFDRIFGGISKQNANLLKLARDRHIDRIAKAAQPTLSARTDAVLGTLGGVPLRLVTRTGGQQRQYVQSKSHLLFDAARNVLYPAVHEDVEKVVASSLPSPSAQGGARRVHYDIGVVDEDVLHGRVHAKLWFLENEDANATSMNPLLTPPPFDTERVSNDTVLYRRTSEPDPNIPCLLAYKFEGRILYPAWRAARTARPVDGMEKQVRMHSLTTALKGFRFLAQTAKVLRLAQEFPPAVLDRSFGLLTEEAASSVHTYTLDGERSRVTLQRRERGTILVLEDTTALLVPYRRMRAFLRSHSLVRMRGLCEQALQDREPNLESLQGIFVAEHRDYVVSGDTIRFS